MIKKGDKIVCIDTRTDYVNEFYENITFGKVYDAEEQFYVNSYRITNDVGKIWSYPMKWFKSLAQLREERINQILDDE
jgi:hypothetical protein